MANLCYCSLSHSSSYDSHLMLWPPLPGPPTNVGPALGVAAPLPPTNVGLGDGRAGFTPPVPPLPLPPKNVGLAVGRATGRVGRPEPFGRPEPLPLETPPQVAAHMRLKLTIAQ